MTRIFGWALVCAAVWMGASVWAEEDGGAATTQPATQPAGEEAVVPYILDVCPVSGQKLGSMGEPEVMVHEGREIKFCCSGCRPRFEKEPAKYLEKMDKMIAAEQRESYPLATCVVSGGELGDESVEIVWRNRLVRFCCEDCVGTFKKDPQKYLDKIDEAAKAKE